MSQKVKRKELVFIVHNYINLTNGVEAISTLQGDYRFIRIQSTVCEQKLWDRLIQDLDYDFLMNLALGHKCIVYDFGARKPIPRAVYQGSHSQGLELTYQKPFVRTMYSVF